MRGGIVGHVEAWEPYSHMAFRFNAASSGTIAAFAEYHPWRLTDRSWK